jgi:hypothetical protein
MVRQSHVLADPSQEQLTRLEEELVTPNPKPYMLYPQLYTLNPDPTP